MNKNLLQKYFLGVVVCCATLLFAPAASHASPTFTAKSLETAIQNSTDYLVNATLPSGQFVYLINLDPNIGMIDSYDIVRHGGAMYGLGIAEEAHPQPKVLDALQRSCKWLLAHQVKPIPGHEKLLGIWETPTKEHAQMISTGDLGLGLVGILSLEKLKPGSVPLDSLQRIGEALLWMQKPDGSFQTAYYPDKSTFDTTYEVLYYPGEAALGLTMLYERDHDKRWLDAAVRALAFLAESRKGSKEIPPDHWAMIATKEVLANYDALDNPPVTRDELVEHARQVCRSLMENQQPASAGIVAGSFSPEGMTTPTATRMEGLIAALGFLPADDVMRAQIRACVDAGVGFLINSQVRSGPYLGAIPQAVTRKPNDGSTKNFVFNVYAGQVRIDFVQHAMDAFVKYQKLISSTQSR
jgi:hypothetical protein